MPDQARKSVETVFKVYHFGPKGHSELSIKSLTRHYNPAPEVVNVQTQGVWVYWRSKRKGTRIRVYRVINEQGDSWANNALSNCTEAADH